MKPRIIKPEGLNAEILLRMDKDLKWAQQEDRYQTLLALSDSLKKPEKVFGPNWVEAFNQTPHEVVCIDEGAIDEPKTPELGLAGSGVLLNDEQFENVVGYCREHGVSKISYHAGCGAAALFCKEYELHHGLKAGSLDPEEEAKKAALRLHSALGLDGAPVFISDKRMRRPKAYHIARSIVIDGTGRMNPGVLDMPSSFQHSFPLHKDGKYTQREVDVAIRIAMGDHGFGAQRFKSDKNRERRLVVLVVGHPTDEELSTGRLREICEPLVKEWGEVVKPIFVDAPKV